MNLIPETIETVSPRAPVAIHHRARAAAVALLAGALGLVGCNTTEGAGEDIQEAGSAIEDAAN